ncbi:MAG: N-acetyltransferase [Candidatus Methylomirabilis oxyfera]|nr:N-acetyltransferase [Candidatus Methylomirabilis oxyfera]
MIRKANMTDVPAIHGLVDFYARKGDLLPRTLQELYERVMDFHVCEQDGEIVGVCSLVVYRADLAEIRSLAVLPAYEGRGIGRAVAEACIAEARTLLIKRVFALTHKTTPFERLGFRVVEKNDLPEKVWRDCFTCSKLYDCDEVAVLLDL